MAEEATAAELSRRYQVARSSVVRALARCQEMHGRDPRIPPPPQPVNPGEPWPRYRVDDMDAWWPHRTKPGRPRKEKSS